LKKKTFHQKCKNSLLKLNNPKSNLVCTQKCVICGNSYFAGSKNLFYIRKLSAFKGKSAYHHKIDKNKWEMETFNDLTQNIQFVSLDLKIALSDLYAKVEFPA